MRREEKGFSHFILSRVPALTYWIPISNSFDLAILIVVASSPIAANNGAQKPKHRLINRSEDMINAFLFLFDETCWTWDI